MFARVSSSSLPASWLLRLGIAVCLLFLLSGLALAGEPSLLQAVQARADVPLDTDPASSFWSATRPALVERDKQGKSLPQFRAEVRTRWTQDNLYFLFICPYDELYLKPSPQVEQETNELWNWDVAEVFLGSDFHNINRYREFEVSPQAEWVDLDIDLDRPHHEDGWTWNSGFVVKARVDAANHRWYAAMKIPFSAIATRPAAMGNEFRVNLFLSQGPPAKHRALAWRAPRSKTFHAPQRFGILRLVPESR
ncbi:MAG: carbohydrate-binding family 9-like protein [Acidobacteria bacterium]|nr:carbohydrate-binding family 9-like protein [Acidobacteriota bacterium]